MIQEIADRVFLFEHGTVEGKNGVVFGDRGRGGIQALAIDAGIHREEGAAMADFVAREGRLPFVLAYTHGHADHVFGSEAFLGATVLAHRDSERVMRAAVESEGATQPVLAWPTQTYSADLTLEIGGRRVLLFPTPGHSPDHVSVLVEDAGVLFAGDAMVTAMVPTIHQGNGVLYERTLRRIAELRLTLLVPGHGEVLRGESMIRHRILEQADYLKAIRRRVRELRHLPADQIVAQVSFEEFVGDRFPPTRHDMINRHFRAVRKIIAEVQKSCE
jgi:glyoxylase-like metal-dependent hydrolase (beta-lactamase superfamily II)